MPRLVALLLVLVLGRSAVEGAFMRQVSGAPASWQQLNASPAAFFRDATDGRATLSSLVPTGVVPSSVAPGDRTPTQSVGAALPQRSGQLSVLRARVAQSARIAVTSSAGRSAFPYDATAPPLRS